jgi:hypothetical protein
MYLKDVSYVNVLTKQDEYKLNWIELNWIELNYGIMTDNNVALNINILHEQMSRIVYH